MGGSSSSLSGGDSYTLTAEKGKKLSDDILHLFFSNANLLKLLKLHNIAECPRFVFTTSDALSTQFQKLQIYPKLGKRGEILFAPIGDLAPGLFKEDKVDAKVQEKIHERNTLCIDVGYFYVRILQIYSALALTTLNADPVRNKRGTTRINPMRTGPQNATLFGGARPSPVNYGPTIGSGPLMAQLGGAIPKTGPFKALYDSIVKTPLEPLVGLLRPDGAPSQTNQIMHFEDGRSGKTGVLYLNWTFPSSTSEFSMEGEFKRTNNDKLAVVFSMKRTSQGVVLLISTPDGRQVEQELKKSLSGWEFVYNLGEGKASEPLGFFDKMYTEFTEQASNTNSTGKGAFASSGSSASSGVSFGSVGGTSSFEGFEQLKKIFQDTADKGSEFPKAYCVARAMTLLNPLFGSELLNQRQLYSSQVCRSKFDFETTEYMPRPGKSARANMYLKSFVSLYYDDYKYNRITGKIELTQSEPSAADLRKASVQFARMYNIQGDQEGFLSPEDGKVKSAVNFTGYPVCAKGEKLLRLKTDKAGKELFAALQSQCIKPMLDFQAAHTIQVNKLLMKMFIIENTKESGVKLRLQPAIRAGGRDGINAIGREAHDLLLAYYLKSEAFYIRGIYLIERSPTAFDSI